MTQYLYRTIAELRSGTIPSIGDIAYVAGHTENGDGGQGFFTWRDVSVVNDSRINDNDGTIIWPLGTVGRWFRMIDGPINVNFWGNDWQVDSWDKIQKAINFAELNATNPALTLIGTPGYEVHFAGLTKAGTTVYIPAGDYKINNTIILKNGVTIIGEGCEYTVLRSNVANGTGGSMVEMASGRITNFTMSDLTFTGWTTGHNVNNTQNCMYFKAELGIHGDGGLWSATFRNIKILDFNGSGIILEGSDQNDEYLLPNQNLIFENVYIGRNKDISPCLKMIGQQGQLTFINCGFDGVWNKTSEDPLRYTASKSANVLIENSSYVQSAVIKFLTCTFQYSEYGALLKFAENITFDNCWFENLDRSVGIFNNEQFKSQGINILNSRFANASGYGNYYDNVRNGSTYLNTTGSCVHVEDSYVTIMNNYVCVSDINPATLSNLNLFVRNIGDNSRINTANNSFQTGILGLISGTETVSVVSNSINTSGYHFLKVNSSSNPIKEIKSWLSGDRYLTIKAIGGSIILDNSKNIVFLSGASSLTLVGSVSAIFVRMEIPYINGGADYPDYWQQIK